MMVLYFQLWILFSGEFLINLLVARDEIPSHSLQVRGHNLMERVKTDSLA